jgi:DNA polymerase I
VLDALPFDEVWGLDFEFVHRGGERPEPVCLVAREVRSDRLIRLWRDELGDRPPFRTDDGALFVAYAAAAEMGCLAVLDWPMPTRVLDLYAEFRARTSGIHQEQGYGLLAALSYHGLSGITSEQKGAGRALVLRGGPWSPAERREVLDYCQTDVDVLGPLLARMLPWITRRPLGLGQALLRGRYTQAVARMELTGVPIDVPTLERIRTHRDAIKLGLIRQVDRDYGVYDEATFKVDRFEALLHRRGVAWPLTDTGRPSLADETFRDMCRLHPWLLGLKDLRHFVDKLKLERLTVGADGRNRFAVMPFGTKTGRNAPAQNGWVFGPSRWVRFLIKPPRGRALAYIDWSSQEVAIAAVLSGDAALLDAVQSGDPYLTFAKMAGLAPPDATKDSHGQARSQCKTCVLGANYGMQAETLAYRIDSSPRHAARILAAMADTFSTYWQWAEHQEDVGQLRREARTVFGWPLHVDGRTRSRTLRNFPMQANGAEMLRLACCLATEAGIEVCAPVHDAVLIEADEADIAAAIETTRAAMAEASHVVLGGLEVATDVAVTRWPDRYFDPDGVELWKAVHAQLESADGQRVEGDSVQEVSEVSHGSQRSKWWSLVSSFKWSPI